MGIAKTIDSVTQYLSEAIARIFRPSDDVYPATGVQPFAGDRYKKRQGSDW